MDDASGENPEMVEQGRANEDVRREETSSSRDEDRDGEVEIVEDPRQYRTVTEARGETSKAADTNQSTTRYDTGHLRRSTNHSPIVPLQCSRCESSRNHAKLLLQSTMKLQKDSEILEQNKKESGQCRTQYVEQLTYIDGLIAEISQKEAENRALTNRATKAEAKYTKLEKRLNALTIEIAQFREDSKEKEEYKERFGTAVEMLKKIEAKRVVLNEKLRAAVTLASEERTRREADGEQLDKLRMKADALERNLPKLYEAIDDLRSLIDISELHSADLANLNEMLSLREALTGRAQPKNKDRGYKPQPKPLREGKVIHMEESLTRGREDETEERMPDVGRVETVRKAETTEQRKESRKRVADDREIAAAATTQRPNKLARTSIRDDKHVQFFDAFVKALQEFDEESYPPVERVNPPAKVHVAEETTYIQQEEEEEEQLQEHHIIDTPPVAIDVSIPAPMQQPERTSQQLLIPSPTPSPVPVSSSASTSTPISLSTRIPKLDSTPLQPDLTFLPTTSVSAPVQTLAPPVQIVVDKPLSPSKAASSAVPPLIIDTSPPQSKPIKQSVSEKEKEIAKELPENANRQTQTQMVKSPNRTMARRGRAPKHSEKEMEPMGNEVPPIEQEKEETQQTYTDETPPMPDMTDTTYVPTRQPAAKRQKPPPTSRQPAAHTVATPAAKKLIPSAALLAKAASAATSTSSAPTTFKATRSSPRVPKKVSMSFEEAEKNAIKRLSSYTMKGSSSAMQTDPRCILSSMLSAGKSYAELLKLFSPEQFNCVKEIEPQLFAKTLIERMNSMTPTDPWPVLTKSYQQGQMPPYPLSQKDTDALLELTDTLAADNKYRVWEVFARMLARNWQNQSNVSTSQGSLYARLLTYALKTSVEGGVIDGQLPTTILLGFLTCLINSDRSFVYRYMCFIMATDKEVFKELIKVVEKDIYLPKILILLRDNGDLAASIYDWLYSDIFDRVPHLMSAEKLVSELLPVNTENPLIEAVHYAASINKTIKLGKKDDGKYTLMVHTQFHLWQLLWKSAILTAHIPWNTTTHLLDGLSSSAFAMLNGAINVEDAENADRPSTSTQPILFNMHLVNSSSLRSVLSDDDVLIFWGKVHLFKTLSGELTKEPRTKVPAATWLRNYAQKVLVLVNKVKTAPALAERSQVLGDALREILEVLQECTNVDLINLAKMIENGNASDVKEQNKNEEAKIEQTEGQTKSEARKRVQRGKNTEGEAVADKGREKKGGTSATPGKKRTKATPPVVSAERVNPKRASTSIKHKYTK